MTDSLTPLADELSRLRSEEKAAAARYQAATAALKNEWELGKELISEWWDGGERDKQPTPTELRQRTEYFLKTLQERDLALGLDVGMPGHRALVPVNPGLREEATAAQYAAGQARSARIAFEAKHAAELAAEKSAAAARQVRDALAGDDVDKIRQTLAT